MQVVDGHLVPHPVSHAFTLGVAKLRDVKANEPLSTLSLSHSIHFSLFLSLFFSISFSFAETQ